MSSLAKKTFTFIEFETMLLYVIKLFMEFIQCWCLLYFVALNIFGSYITGDFYLKYFAGIVYVI